MHAAAYAFVCTAIADLQPRAVLEIGSLDVNSTAQRMNVRTLVGDAAYTGIDTHPGLGVDIVASAADYDGDGAFDAGAEAARLGQQHVVDVDVVGHHITPMSWTSKVTGWPASGWLKSN